MNLTKPLYAIFACLSPFVIVAQDVKRWTLQECFAHALEHNISLRQNKITEQEGEETFRQSRAALFPSLSANMSQTLSYRPLQKEASNIVANGMANSSSNKLTENGSYGLNAQWTVWNGGVNYNKVKLQRLVNEQNTLTTAQTANSIQEQIAQLYIQILYSTEAVKVNESLLKTAESQYDRGTEMQNQGLLSKADLTQLEAQVSNARYNKVNAESMVVTYKRQLKQLLELEPSAEFDIADITVDDRQALDVLPDKMEVYHTALLSRPEIRNSRLSLESTNLSLKSAKGGYQPTISLTASIGDSHYSASSWTLGEQMRQNLNAAIGLNVSIPLFDNRTNRTAVRKAKLAMVSSQLQLEEQQKSLYNTIDTYWQDAQTGQMCFRAACDKVKSAQNSYDLLSEQFNNGLKNIVELQTGYDNVLSALQDKLQNKYTTLLNIQLLRFYMGNDIRL